jgi:hypothetical protein
MIATAFTEENAVLDGPPGTTSEQVESLSVCRCENENGVPVLVSCWKVTKEELEEIQRTGRVWLIVLGHTTFPVRLCTNTGLCTKTPCSAQKPARGLPRLPQLPLPFPSRPMSRCSPTGVVSAWDFGYVHPSKEVWVTGTLLMGLRSNPETLLQPQDREVLRHE